VEGENMRERSEYEEEIIKELKDIPSASLPKVLKMIHFLKEEILIERKAKKALHDEGKQILLSLGEGLGEGPDDLADRHNYYLYG
jgi:predicted methyltransferase